MHWAEKFNRTDAPKKIDFIRKYRDLRRCGC